MKSRLIPQPEGQAIFLQKNPATWAAARIVPRFHEMFWPGRTRQRQFLPDERGGFFPFGIRGDFPQNYRGNFRPVKAGKFARFQRRTGPPPHPDQHIIKFAAVAAEHRLHLAMHPAVRPARNFRAILALRTFEDVSAAHALEIQPLPTKLKPDVKAYGPGKLAMSRQTYGSDLIPPLRCIHRLISRSRH